MRGVFLQLYLKLGVEVMVDGPEGEERWGREGASMETGR